MHSVHTCLFIVHNMHNTKRENQQKLQGNVKYASSILVPLAPLWASYCVKVVLPVFLPHQIHVFAQTSIYPTRTND